MACDGPPGGRPLPASLGMQKTMFSPVNPWRPPYTPVVRLSMTGTKEQAGKCRINLRGTFSEARSSSLGNSVSPFSAYSVFCAAGRGDGRASGLVPCVDGACLISIQGRQDCTISTHPLRLWAGRFAAPLRSEGQEVKRSTRKDSIHFPSKRSGPASSVPRTTRLPPPRGTARPEKQGHSLRHYTP